MPLSIPSFCPRTAYINPQKAWVQANIEAAKLDAYWGHIRLAQSDVLGLSLVKGSSMSVRSVMGSSLNTIPEASNYGPSLLDALQVYLDHKGKGRPKSFRLAAE